MGGIATIRNQSSVKKKSQTKAIQPFHIMIDKEFSLSAGATGAVAY